MKKIASGKNLLQERREQKKLEKISLLRDELFNNREIPERSRSFKGVKEKLNEINKDLENFDKKDQLNTIESKINKLNINFGTMKKDIGEIKDTMNSLLLISLSKDTYCPVNQRIKISKILQKQREKILRNFNNSNPNNKINNQINPNIATPIREKKLKTPPKKDKPAFSNKYEHRKSSSTININKKKSYNSLKINIKENLNLADSYTDDFSSKKSETKYSQNQSINVKNNNTSSVINVRTSFNSLNNKKYKNRGSDNKFQANIDKKEDKKQQIKYTKNKGIYKPANNIRKKEDKKKLYFKYSQEQSDNSSKSQSRKFVITYSKDSSSGDKKDQKDGK